MRPEVSALAATDTADEARLDVTQSDIIGPVVGDHFDPVRASEVGGRKVDILPPATILPHPI
jgi:hypothetical protein